MKVELESVRKSINSALDNLKKGEKPSEDVMEKEDDCCSLEDIIIKRLLERVESGMEKEEKEEDD